MVRSLLPGSVTSVVPPGCSSTGRCGRTTPLTTDAAWRVSETLVSLRSNSVSARAVAAANGGSTASRPISRVDGRMTVDLKRPGYLRRGAHCNRIPRVSDGERPAGRGLRRKKETRPSTGRVWEGDTVCASWGGRSSDFLLRLALAGAG